VRRQPKAQSNVIDLVAILQKSLDQAKPKTKQPDKSRSTPRRNAA
jgi:non-homologous end joining protein Ku